MPLPRHQLPPAPPGRRIGLFGGSFDPAHQGHLALSRAALRALRLDCVWWLVSPGNPLKSAGPTPLPARLERAAALTAGDRRLVVTGVESRLGTRYTADTLAALRPHLAGAHPVWLMGADSLAGLHRWRDWQAILHQIPVAVLARPGANLSALGSVAARRFAACRLPEHKAAALATARPPRWCFLRMPMVDVSSTGLRARAVSGTVDAQTVSET